MYDRLDEYLQLLLLACKQAALTGLGLSMHCDCAKASLSKHAAALQLAVEHAGWTSNSSAIVGLSQLHFEHLAEA